jgi:hypothetical protein
MKQGRNEPVQEFFSRIGDTLYNYKVKNADIREPVIVIPEVRREALAQYMALPLAVRQEVCPASFQRMVEAAMNRLENIIVSLEKLSTVHSKTFYRLQEQMNIFNFTIHYKKGSEMPADFLSQYVRKAINVFDQQLPELQKQDLVCKFVRDFIQNLDNPKANQELFKNPKANK